MRRSTAAFGVMYLLAGGDAGALLSLTPYSAHRANAGGGSTGHTALAFDDVVHFITGIAHA